MIRLTSMALGASIVSLSILATSPTGFAGPKNKKAKGDVEIGNVEMSNDLDPAKNIPGPKGNASEQEPSKRQSLLRLQNDEADARPAPKAIYGKARHEAVCAHADFQSDKRKGEMKCATQPGSNALPVICRTTAQTTAKAKCGDTHCCKEEEFLYYCGDATCMPGDQKWNPIVNMFEKNYSAERAKQGYRNCQDNYPLPRTADKDRQWERVMNPIQKNPTPASRQDGAAYDEIDQKYRCIRDLYCDSGAGKQQVMATCKPEKRDIDVQGKPMSVYVCGWGDTDTRFRDACANTQDLGWMYKEQRQNLSLEAAGASSDYKRKGTADSAR